MPLDPQRILRIKSVFLSVGWADILSDRMDNTYITQRAIRDRPSWEEIQEHHKKHLAKLVFPSQIERLHYKIDKLEKIIVLLEKIVDLRGETNKESTSVDNSRLKT